MIVLGKINKTELQVLLIQCKVCGGMFEITGFNHEGICNECLKEAENVRN
jgi:hypothetical protein